jgi:transcription termination factor Rho
MELLIDKIRATKNNGEFFDSMGRGGAFPWVVHEGR